MDYTEDQIRGFQQQFSTLRKRQLLATIPMLAVLVVMVLADRGAAIVLGLPAAVWMPIAGVCVVGLVVFSLLNWRCPACKRYLGKGFGPKYCTRCGVQLQS